MPQFKFRLTTLQKLREAARDECRAQLAEAYQAEAVVRGRLDELVADLEALRNQARAVTAKGQVNVDAILDNQRYEMALKVEQQIINGQIAGLQAEIERRRQVLIAADREVRVLEKLRDAQYVRHQQQEAVIELKQFDEIAARSTAREEFS